MQEMQTRMNRVYRNGRTFLMWILGSLLIGVVCGAVGTAFHLAVDWATEARLENGWLLYLLPAAGLVIAAVYRWANIEGAGTNNIIQSIHSGKHIPTRLVPVIFVSTTLTHLYGGSAGREGAALQIGGGLGCRIGEMVHADDLDKRELTLCGMAAVFAALFATPVTASIFVLEVATVGMIQYSALVPCLISSFTAYGVASLFGLSGSHYAAVVQGLEAAMLGKAALFAVFLAVMSIIECAVLHNAEHWAGRIKSRFARAFAGGVIIIVLTLLLGTRDYNGAGGDVIAAALNGSLAHPSAFVWKLIFTAVSIGFGFKGGEIVPTFFIGATLGCLLGPLFGIPAELAAALGLVGLFCGVVNCPVASIFLSIELFGAGALPYFALVCGVCYMLSGHYSLYSGSQYILFSKTKWEAEKDHA